MRKYDPIRKPALILLFLFMGMLVKAQIVLTNTTLQYNSNDSTSYLEATLTVNNNNTDSVHVMVIREIVYKDPNHDESFCFGEYCYVPNTDTSLYYTNINSQDFESTFIAHADPLNHYGYDIMHYRFYDIYNPSDSAAITIQFNFTTTGLNEKSETSFLKFNNPANNFSLISYHLPFGLKDASVELYNILGVKLRSMQIEEVQGTTMMTTSSLPNGVYLLNLVSDHKVKNSYRLIISH